MWNKIIYKLNGKGLLCIAVLNILYLAKLAKEYFASFGGEIPVNVTGYFILALSEKYFLTFMIPLSILYMISAVNRRRQLEVIRYESKGAWTEYVMTAGAVCCAAYFAFLLAALIVVAWVSGMDFSNLKAPCTGMEMLLYDILQAGAEVNMVWLALSNILNAFCYCITIMMLYLCVFSIVRRRSMTWLLASALLVVNLTVVKLMWRSFYPYTFLGNVVLNVSYDRWNTGLNWGYWGIVNLAMVVITLACNKKREISHDE